MVLMDDYKVLIVYARKMLDKRKLQITCEDVVNDAFIYFSDKEYARQSAIKFLQKNIFAEQSFEQNHFSDPEDATIEENEKCCPKCKESKPVAAFYFWYKAREGRKVLSDYCIECTTKLREKYHTASIYIPMTESETRAARTIRARIKAAALNTTETRGRKSLNKSKEEVREEKRLYQQKWVAQNRDKWNTYVKQRILTIK